MRSFLWALFRYSRPELYSCTELESALSDHQLLWLHCLFILHMSLDVLQMYWRYTPDFRFCIQMFTCPCLRDFVWQTLKKPTCRGACLGTSIVLTWNPACSGLTMGSFSLLSPSSAFFCPLCCSHHSPWMPFKEQFWIAKCPLFGLSPWKGHCIVHKLRLYWEFLLDILEGIVS